MAYGLRRISTTFAGSGTTYAPRIICEDSKNEEKRENDEFAAKDAHQSEEKVTTRFASRKDIHILNGS